MASIWGLFLIRSYEYFLPKLLDEFFEVEYSDDRLSNLEECFLGKYSFASRGFAPML